MPHLFRGRFQTSRIGCAVTIFFFRDSFCLFQSGRLPFRHFFFFFFPSCPLPWSTRFSACYSLVSVSSSSLYLPPKLFRSHPSSGTLHLLGPVVFLIFYSSHLFSYPPLFFFFLTPGCIPLSLMREISQSLNLFFLFVLDFLSTFNAFPLLLQFLFRP